MRYLALDPGLTTGIATYHARTGAFDSLEIRGRDNLYDYLEDFWGMAVADEWRRATPPDVLVIERWDVRKDTYAKSAQEDARYIIGAVEWWATRPGHGIRYVEQRPAEAKKFATNDKLDALGWRTGGEGHADDAARHLLVCLAKDRVERIIEGIT